MLRDGEGGDGVREMRRFKDVPFELHQPGGETADEGVARAGGVHGVDDVGLDTRVDVGLRHEAALGTEGHDHDRHAEGPAKRVQAVGGEAVQGLDGTEAYTRGGSLDISADGTLMTSGGLTVLGDGGPIQVPANSEVSIAPDGTVSAKAANGRSSSVGTAAIQRFLRPVCYQNLPRVLLPAKLREPNERGIWRRRDGALTRN